jgi:hypothetical protein
MPPPAGKKKRSAAQKLALAKGRANILSQSASELDAAPEPTLSSLTEKLASTEKELHIVESALQVSELQQKMQQMTMDSTQKQLEVAAEAAKATVSKNAMLYKALRTTRCTLQRANASKMALKDKITILQTVEVPAAKKQAELAIKLLEVSEEKQAQNEKNLSNAIDNLVQKLQSMDVRHRVSKQQLCALQMKCSRAPEILAKKVAQAEEKVQKEKKELHLVQKGVYTPEAKSLARLLVQAGCSKQYVGAVIEAVCKAAGVSVDVTMSSCTVSRAILEGGITAEIQLGFEIANSNNLTIGMDGTTHRHINLEAKYIHINNMDDNGKHQHKSLLVGVDPAVDHKSETQIAGWLSKIQDIADVYGSSPLA